MDSAIISTKSLALNDSDKREASSVTPQFFAILEYIGIRCKINSLKADNNLIQIKISSLQNLSSSRDLIDEQVRRVLGYGKSNEYIIFFNN